MTLEDAVADVMLRAILRSPKKYPRDTVDAARNHRQTWPIGGHVKYHDWTEEDYEQRLKTTATWKVFVNYLKDLPAMEINHET